jgi:hypothetical protein
VNVIMKWNKFSETEAVAKLEAFTRCIPDLMAMLQREMRAFSSQWMMDYTRASVYYAYMKLATRVEIEERVEGSGNVWISRPLYDNIPLMEYPTSKQWRVSIKSRPLVLCAGVYLAESVRKENAGLRWCRFTCNEQREEHNCPTLCNDSGTIGMVFPHLHSARIVERGVEIRNMEKAVLDYMFNCYDVWRLPDDEFGDADEKGDDAEFQ